MGIVLGLPRNMDGTEGPRCQSTRAFARNLAPLVAIPIGFWDERLSTVAAERGIHEVDLFLDLVVEYGRSLRWYTTVANQRQDVLNRMVQDDNTLITFSHAGAHIRNMAFYNLPLRFLKLVKQSHDRGTPVMSLEKAVWRMTGEQRRVSEELRRVTAPEATQLAAR